MVVIMTTNMKSNEDVKRHIIIRGYSKVVYLWPAMVVGFIVTFLEKIASNGINNVPAQDYAYYLCAIWFIVFTFNIIVIGFDFSLGKIFTIFVCIFALALLYLIIFPRGINTGLSFIDLLKSMNMSASDGLYFWISMMILIVLIISIIQKRFDYWEIESNRIVHHRGLFEREESFSAQNSRVTTQIDDIFERILFLSGTVLITDPERIIHAIYNVFGANVKDKKIQDLLSVIRVKNES